MSSPVLHYSRLLGGPFASQDETALCALAARMEDVPRNRRQRNRGGDVPFSGLIYLGQFIDHDLTRDNSTLPEAGTPPETRFNHRTSWLDLDSVYAGGPEENGAWFDHSRPEAERFFIGQTSAVTLPNGRELPGTFDDLYRINGVPALGDDRNDENLIVAQLHVLFQQFHNRLLDYFEHGRIERPEQYGPTPFAQAHRLVLWHYHWLVRHEFLPRIILPQVFQDLITAGPRFFRPVQGEMPALPVEFTQAAYRFGHSAVQHEYTLNSFRAGVPLLELFNPGPPGVPTPPMRADSVIDWGFFTRMYANANVAENVDTLVARDLYQVLVPTFSTDPKLPAAIPLPTATLIRGSRIGLPSGQEACALLGIAPLERAQIGFDREEAEFLSACGFEERTPLWYYILREAEVLGMISPQSRFGGECLGPLGSRIVGEVLLGALNSDPADYLNVQPDWQPPLLRFGKSQTPRPINELAALAVFAKDRSALD